MLKRLLVYILLILSTVFISNSCRKSNSNGAEVKGRIKNIKENYFLATREFKDSLFIDTIKVNSRGEFSFSINVDTLTIVSLYFENKTKYSYFLLDKKWKVEINGDAKYPGLFNVQGGDINNELTAFRKQNKDVLKKRSNILDLLMDTTNANDTLLINKKNDYISELANLNFDLSNAAADYVKANPEKISSVFVINAFFKDESFIPRLDECLEQLRGKAATFSLTGDLSTYSTRIKKSQEGAIAPYFSRHDINDKTFNLSSLRGKYVLLSFVSTTSKVSEEQREPLVNIYKELKRQKENIEFVTVLINIEEEDIPKEVLKKIEWILIPEKGGWSSELLELYNVKELPCNILISPTGNIVKRDVPTFIVEDVYKELAGKGN